MYKKPGSQAVITRNSGVGSPCGHAPGYATAGRTGGNKACRSNREGGWTGGMRQHDFWL